MNIRSLKAEIVRRAIRQRDVARQIGIDVTVLSLYLNGHRQPPRDLEERVLSALEVLERADRAAAEARAAVLAGQPRKTA